MIVTPRFILPPDPANLYSVDINFSTNVIRAIIPIFDTAGAFVRHDSQVVSLPDLVTLKALVVAALDFTPPASAVEVSLDNLSIVKPAKDPV